MEIKYNRRGAQCDADLEASSWSRAAPSAASTRASAASNASTFRSERSCGTTGRARFGIPALVMQRATARRATFLLHVLECDVTNQPTSVVAKQSGAAVEWLLGCV